jgi:dethiobiotin synthetase
VSTRRGLFVIGTDTGVGKTTVGCGLLRLARRRGLTPIPFKPVETGCAPDPLDALALWRAARPPVTVTDVCPFALRLPAAPALAAAAEGVELDADRLTSRAVAAGAAGDFLLVEGAGGLLVPYVGAVTTAELAVRLGLPLVVVGRTALGTINHTALTLREAARHELTVAGLVLSRTDAAAAPHEDGNIDLIEAVTGVRALGTLPHLPPDARDDADRLADALVDALGPIAVDRLLGS